MGAYRVYRISSSDLEEKGSRDSLKDQKLGLNVIFSPYLEKILQYTYVKHLTNLPFLVLTFLLKLFAHSNNCDLLLKCYPCYNTSSMIT